LRPKSENSPMSRYIVTIDMGSCFSIFAHMPGDFLWTNVTTVIDSEVSPPIVLYPLKI
jgi:hypothetical protein